MFGLTGSRTEVANLVVIDSVFPQKQPFAFRNQEINEYIHRVKGFKAYTMYPMRPKDAPFAHSYGQTEGDYQENKKGYLKFYPDNEPALSYIDKKKKYRFQLAYSFFLGETYSLLSFYEKNKVPFVFVLYPGGLFSLTSPEAESMLREICSSKWFRGVITTQDITKDYLIQKSICNEKSIHNIYGGFVQFHENDVIKKKKYLTDKKTFDICFVAAKYSERGIDKGYDLFIDCAKKLSRKSDDFVFHVVGGFDESDIDISDIKHRIKFHGYLMPQELSKFYSKMDVFLSPNRPGELYEGNFDGFPLGIDAGYCGVALFVADELNMNSRYQDGVDIEIIPLDTDKITKRIMLYKNKPEKLHELSKRCKHTTQKLFDINTQVNQRLEVFSKYMDIDYNDS